MTSPTRRLLVASLAALAAGGPALAQTRYRTRDPYGADPYGDGVYDWAEEGDLYRRPRGRAARDPLFEGNTPDPYEPPALRQRFEPGRSALAEGGEFDYGRIYGRVDGEPFPVPAFNYARIGPEYLRREVAYPGREEPGAIVVDPHRRFLYLVQGGGRAIRYGVGVGKQGFSWSGVATINSKQEWPDWYPPKEMIERQPGLMRQLSELRSGIGVPGGPRNPLGARALYLWQGNKDTLYRIHGTLEPWTIGTSVSSGCIRMVNQDAIDLYTRTSVGARVLVLG
jgi:lipoprotein-anchoring transpeptidase ErfK/SrfK